MFSDCEEFPFYLFSGIIMCLVQDKNQFSSQNFTPLSQKPVITILLIGHELGVTSPGPAGLQTISLHFEFNKNRLRTSIGVFNLHVPVDLLGLPVATEQTTEDPHAAHPGQLLWHTGVGCTLSLT